MSMSTACPMRWAVPFPRPEIPLFPLRVETGFCPARLAYDAATEGEPLSSPRSEIDRQCLNAVESRFVESLNFCSSDHSVS